MWICDGRRRIIESEVLSGYVCSNPPSHISKALIADCAAYIWGLPKNTSVKIDITDLDVGNAFIFSIGGRRLNQLKRGDDFLATSDERGVIKLDGDSTATASGNEFLRFNFK